ncbi:MAG TPA: class I SAM-dependent methyltransferase [Mucilaginibacter sp.]|nr:class I SAM-dependent methyltransferase [Mucilaginibacter sp.]
MFEIQTHIQAIENNAELYDEKNFNERMEAIDFIEFQVIDQIEELSLKTDQPTQLSLLKHRAEKIKSDLEAIDTNLFQKLRTNIRAKGCTGKDFKNLVSEYVDFNLDDNEHQEEAGYDNLDIFINGLLAGKVMPEQTKDLEPEMVYYQKTPARIVFELAEKSHFTEEDVFFDLGSGLGQVAILVNLLAGITVKGIEFEPAFCDYARDCAAELNLSKVEFINIDARKADDSAGTIFFLYTPFKGEMLREILDSLREESLSRQIKLITYGPCTAEVALQSWLDFAGPQHDNPYKLGFFTS